MQDEFAFVDPVPVLKAFREIEVSGALSDLPERVRRLRTGKLKNPREARDAAIFAHGLATVLGTKVFVRPGEDDDFDFMVHWREEGAARFCPVQLKELAPDDLNAEQTIDDVLVGLKKYSPTDTIVAILINKSLKARELSLKGIPFREVWLFWQSSPDASRWGLEGDLLTGSRRYEFTYPE